MNKTKALFNSAIVLYFIIALEILIMISPFAVFLLSVQSRSPRNKRSSKGYWMGNPADTNRLDSKKIDV